jgi:hypothetical protein
MYTEWKAPVARSRTTKAKVANLTLAAAESGQLIGICVGPINFTAKLTGSIESAVGLIVEYAYDEVLSWVPEIGS